MGAGLGPKPGLIFPVNGGPISAGPANRAVAVNARCGAYVQMADEGGGTQAILPRSGLSLNGKG